MVKDFHKTRPNQERTCSVSAHVTCKCGKMQFWLPEGQVTKNPCPECGRKYFGKYNPETLTIDKIEHKTGWTPSIINDQWKMTAEGYNDKIDVRDIVLFDKIKWFLSTFKWLRSLRTVNK